MNRPQLVNRFILIFVIVFSLLFLRSWHLIGPISFRNATAIVLFAFAVIRYRKMILTSNAKLYFVWVLIYVLLCCINGGIYSGAVITNLVAYHFVSLILLFSLPILLKKKTDLDILAVVFLFLFIFNCILTIMQFFNIEMGWAIGEFISPMKEDKIDELAYVGQGEETMLFHSMANGINGFVVTNGHFVACFLPFATYTLWKKGISNFMLGILVLLLALVSIVAIQQRMALVVWLLYVLILAFFRVGKLAKISIAFLFVVLSIYITSVDIPLEMFGRLSMTDDNRRYMVIDKFMEFISNTSNFMFGHPATEKVADEEMLLTIGHVSILDGMRRGGIICFLLHIYLFFSVLVECIRIIRKSKKVGNYYSVGFAICVILNLMYSLTHSDGITSGSVFLWGSYSLMVVSQRVFVKNSLENHNSGKLLAK